MNGAQMIAVERARQIEDENWSAKHDDEHINGELADAAAVYAMKSSFRSRRVRGGCGTETVASELWPWDCEWWKPQGGRIKQLVKAGALIAAEIDRLKRTHAHSANVPTHPRAVASRGEAGCSAIPKEVDCG